jgi:hypothetical protein
VTDCEMSDEEASSPQIRSCFLCLLPSFLLACLCVSLSLILGVAHWVLLGLFLIAANTGLFSCSTATMELAPVFLAAKNAFPKEGDLLWHQHSVSHLSTQGRVPFHGTTLVRTRWMHQLLVVASLLVYTSFYHATRRDWVKFWTLS